MSNEIMHDESDPIYDGYYPFEDEEMEMKWGVVKVRYPWDDVWNFGLQVERREKELYMTISWWRGFILIGRMDKEKFDD